MAINLLDMVFLGLVVGFVLWSMMNGAAREILSLLGLLGGLLAADWWQAPIAEWLSPMISDANLAGLTAAGGLILGGLLGGALLGGFAESMNREPGNGMGRLLAAGVGLAKGVAVAMTITWAINGHLPGLQDDLAASWSGPVLMDLLGQLNRLPLI